MAAAGAAGPSTASGPPAKRSGGRPRSTCSTSGHFALDLEAHAIAALVRAFLARLPGGE
jgi:hypothetical protein